MSVSSSRAVQAQESPVRDTRTAEAIRQPGCEYEVSWFCGRVLPLMPRGGLISVPRRRRQPGPGRLRGPRRQPLPRWPPVLGRWGLGLGLPARAGSPGFGRSGRPVGRQRRPAHQPRPPYSRRGHGFRRRPIRCGASAPTDQPPLRWPGRFPGIAATLARPVSWHGRNAGRGRRTLHRRCAWPIALVLDFRARPLATLSR
jgi:hypothetical protein